MRTVALNRKLFYLLWAGVIAGLFAIVPYTAALKSAAGTYFTVRVLVQIAVNGLIYGLLTYIGLRLALFQPRTGERHGGPFYADVLLHGLLPALV